MQLFYYDVLKILSFLTSKNLITKSEKEEIKNLVLKNESKFLEKLHSIYNSESANKELLIKNEMIRYTMSSKQKQRGNSRNKKMKIITEETEELEEDLIKVQQQKHRLEKKLF
ncbi:unnamed protein product [Paramecium pentaurelia]|uniref:Uncharacterized protein n=1 Tax=Paramecium pentaurelia TaxID=43138 RepID=A0A8S1XNK8_9CILI|nr:unnamed protein product [Paramecium pentaurelia]